MQKNAVDEAIALFSGEDSEKAREIWLVDSAPVMIEKYEEAVKKLGVFMQEQGLVCEPEAVYNVKGDAARIAFIKNFKEIQRIKTQLDQYTDLMPEQVKTINNILAPEKLLQFRSSYIETAKQLQDIRPKEDGPSIEDIENLDFELVLFASAIIDYDYIMNLIADNTQKKPAKQKMTKEQIKSLLKSTSNLMGEEEDLSAFIDQVDWSVGQNVKEVKQNFDAFLDEKLNQEILAIANTHELDVSELKSFVDGIIGRMIFDGEKLTELLSPLDLGWKERGQKELALMKDLVPHLKKLSLGRSISGLAAYE